MGNRSLLTIIGLLAVAVFAFASTPDDRETESRADLIRLDEGYLFAERYFSDLTDTDLMVMTDDALSELAVAVNEVRNQVKKKPLTVVQLYPLAGQLDYRIGNRRCVFLFIPVDKAISFEPTAAESVGAASAGEGGPALNTTSATENATSASGSESPEDPEAVTTVTINPGGVASDSVAVAAALPAVAASTGASDVASAIAARNGLMLGELGKLLLQYRNDGRIEDFGQVRPGREIPSDAFLVIVDRSLKVKQILVPHIDGSQRDLKTGTPEDPSGFHNCGIVWFK